MGINTWIFLIFILVAGILIYINRNKVAYTTDKISFYSDEKTLYEEYPLKKFRRKYAKNSETAFPNSKVTITNYRILLSQKGLFSSKFVLNSIITYKTNPKEEDGHIKNEKFLNYMDVSKSDISFENVAGTDLVTILEPETNITKTFESIKGGEVIEDIAKIAAITGNVSINNTTSLDRPSIIFSTKDINTVKGILGYSFSNIAF